jgi:hypothetical protein
MNTFQQDLQDLAAPFDEHYFRYGCGEPYERSPAWLNLHNAYAEHITHFIQPASVLDAGCAIGLLVEALRTRNIEAWGIDISPYAICQVSESAKPYCRVHSISEPFGQRYSLIVCIEVLEHLPKAESEKALANLCAHTDDVLFSSSPQDYAEATHFNVQPPEYWAELFAQHGFYRDVDFDASFITPWAARFRKSNEPAHRLARDYERAFWRLHNENAQLRKQANQARDALAHKSQLKSLLIEERNAALAEMDRLLKLVQGYERGRFMRFMRWLKQARKP